MVFKQIFIFISLFVITVSGKYFRPSPLPPTCSSGSCEPGGEDCGVGCYCVEWPGQSYYCGSMGERNISDIKLN